MSEEIQEVENDEEELFEHYRFKSDPGQELLRIDKFLMDRLPGTSRNKIQIAAKNGNILVNGNVVKPNYRIKPRMMRFPSFCLIRFREIELIPQDIPIDIIYEDDYLILVNKPANMVVHPGYGNYTGTMVNALVYHFDQPAAPHSGLFRPAGIGSPFG